MVQKLSSSAQNIELNTDKSIAIMQPYFFPYLGYFELIASVNTFVVLDDVKFTKNSWINRNKLLIAGEPRWLSVPVIKYGGSLDSIRSHSYGLTQKFWRKTRESIKQSYGQTAGLDLALDILAEWEQSGDSNVATSNWRLITRVMEYLGIKLERILYSSEHSLGIGLRGQERIVKICQELQCNHYFNLPGGQSLYDSAYFERNGLELSFIEPNLFPYPQTVRPFNPGLSVLDFLLNVGLESNRLFRNARDPAHLRIET